MGGSVDSVGCVGNSIAVASGGYLDLLDPEPSVITIESIAKGLANTCRYGGQCKFYSVAEHSILAAKSAREHGHEYVDSDEDLLLLEYEVLMHDAAEAFVGDIPKPLKNLLPSYGPIESKMQSVIRDRFGVTDRFSSIVKVFDYAMLKAEKPALFGDTREWEGMGGVPDFGIELDFYTPTGAEFSFIIAFESIRKRMGMDK